MCGIGAYNVVCIPSLTPHGAVHDDTLTRRPVLPLRIGGTPPTPMRGPDLAAMGPVWHSGLTRAWIRPLPSLLRAPSRQTLHPLQSRRPPLPLAVSPLVAAPATRESTTAPPLVSRLWPHSFPDPASSARRSGPLRRRACR